MPDLLLELRSEEIPARMQRKAAGDLKKLVTDALVNAGLNYEGAQDYWTPRRLTLDIRGLSARGQDVREEIKGPATSAPEQAVQGFLRKAGLSSVADAHVHSDPKKGDFYVAHIVKPGRVAADVIAEAMPKIIREFPWPKSMRWGKASAKPGSLRWVRPLQSIVCLLSTEPEEPVVVEFEVDGIRSGNITHGHRFHAPEAFLVKRFDDYAAKLEKAKVVLSAERRKEMILTDARNLAFASGLELIEDDGLLEEVSGLVEWPVVLMGSFEEDYLAIPGEVIRLTIRANQKCFVTRAPRASRLAALAPQHEGVGDFQTADENTNSLQPEAEGSSSPHPEVRAQRASKDEGSLSNKFILVSNIEARDGGAEIVHGNGKVVRARLSDAVHFWKTDQANVPDLDALKESAAKFDLDLTKPLDQRMARLDHLNVTFHAKLGSQGERVARIAKLAEELAAVLEKSPSPLWGGARGGGAQGANNADFTTATTAKDSREAPPPPTPPLKGEGSIANFARRAAVLCKADLQTEVVGEFPELQGLMGRKYAGLQGEHPSVCAAMEDHYKPQGPSDRVPSDPVAIAVALADKLDTLVGFWAIDEKPTGSKDPYALRRAALGVIRILLERGVRFPLLTAVRHWYRNIFDLAEEADRSVLFVDHGDHSTGSSIHNRWTNPTNDFYDLSSDEMFISRNGIGTLTINDLDELEGSERRPIIQLLVARVPSDLLAFFHDRLKVYLRDQGARHDLIDAVITPDADDLLLIARKVEALSAYINTDEGQNLTAGVKRVANILAAEEKKGAVIGNVIDVTKFTDPLETALFEALNDATHKAGLAVDREDYAGAMQELSRLRAPVDAFLDGVLVNDPDPAVKANRLALLNDMKKAAQRVADFSKISG